MNKDFCNNVVTIPQFLSTCWFNAILMMFLYSQNSRKLLLNIDYFKNSKDPFIKVFNNLLNRYYINPKEATQYLNIMRPENILKFFNFEEKMYKFIINKGWQGFFLIPTLMEKFNMSYIMLEHYDNNFYLGINERIYYNYDDKKKGFLLGFKFKNNEKTIDAIKENIKNDIKKYTINQPKYLVINLWEKKDYIYNINNKNIYQLFAQTFDIKNYNIPFSNLYQLKDKIQFNGYTYILDSCYLGNYNIKKANMGHAICGITCKNNRFVYNGWFRTTQDPSMKVIAQDKLQSNTLPCELMKFNWNIHDKNNKFCLNPRLCSIENLNKTDNNFMCFSFYKGHRILIYVLQDESFKSQDVNISISKSIKSKPKDETITKPKDETITKPKDETITKPKDETITKPKDETITKPKDETITKTKKEVKPKEPKTKKEVKPKEPKTKKEVKPKEPKTKKEVKPKEPKTKKEVKPKEPKTKKEVKPKEPKTKKEVKPKEPKTKKEVKLKDETKTKEEVKKICPQGKILNPLTNRCINIKK